MKLFTQTKKKIRSVRVKTIEFHPTKDMCVVGLYNGYLQTWNSITGILINETQITEFPIRTLAIVEKTNSVLIGADDGNIHVYELNNLQKLNCLDAHNDFIRKIVIHHKNEEFLSCSDDGTIKLWKLGKEIICLNIFTGHSHFVMDICYFPKDSKLFLSCSLDTTIKLWDKETGTCKKTYKGHVSGVNSIAFCSSEDYFVSGSDDLTMKIWSAANVQCISTLKGHSNNIINVYTFEKLPYIVSCSEDGSYKFWDVKSYICKETVHLNSGRVWQFKEKNNCISIGTDEELIFKKIKMGVPLVSMRNRKLFFSDQNNIYSCKIDDYHNIKKISELNFFPSEIKLSENGKTIAVVQDKNFTIYSSLGFRKRFEDNGTNFNFLNSDEFFVLNENFINFYKKTEKIKSLKIEGICKIFHCRNLIVGVFDNKTNIYTIEGIRIFSFEFGVSEIVEVQGYMIIKAENKIKVYHLNTEIIEAYLEQELQIDKEGIPDSFIFLKEFNQEYRSYCYIKNIFIFENDSRLNYIILQKDPFLYEYGTFNGVIGGIDNGIIYAVANSKVEIYKIDEDFINFQNHVFNNEKCEIQEKFRLRAISFYESLNMNDKALEICNNKNLKFEILVKSKKLNEAFEYCETPYMYEKLGELFFSINDYDNAALCFYNSKNWKRLFHVDMINKKNYLNKTAENLYKNGDLNYAFLAYMKLNDYEKCGELLQESKFYNIFKKTFLNK